MTLDSHQWKNCPKLLFFYKNQGKLQLHQVNIVLISNNIDMAYLLCNIAYLNLYIFKLMVTLHIYKEIPQTRSLGTSKIWDIQPCI